MPYKTASSLLYEFCPELVSGGQLEPIILPDVEEPSNTQADDPPFLIRTITNSYCNAIGNCCKPGSTAITAVITIEK
jgi:hypothetical protein